MIRVEGDIMATCVEDNNLQVYDMLIDTGSSPSVIYSQPF